MTIEKMPQDADHPGDAEPEIVTEQGQMTRVSVPIGIRSEAMIAKADLVIDGIPSPKVLFTLKDPTGEKKALWDVGLARAIAQKIVECCDLCAEAPPKLATIQPNRLIIPGR